ncbi:MAG TPA: two-component regulator propeller domain-containing protein, partial [Bacteroidota bacterium]|nr:two-component regulator propeller domain-containing protein [Bacteroidota bacterium]
TALCEDKSGTLWVATYGAGLARLTHPHGPGPPVFTHFQHDPDDPTSISGNAIDAMIIDERDILWFGTAQGGLNRTISSVSDAPRPSFRSFPHDPLDPTTLLSNTTSCIYKDNAGLIWYPDYQLGVSVFDSRRKPFRLLKHHPKNPDSPSDGTVMTVHEDQSGTLWIGTWDGGLDAWDRTTGRFTHYDHVFGDPQSLSENRVYSFAEDKSGCIWVGTYNDGLNRFDRATKTFRSFRYDRSDSTSIRENCIRSIAGDGSGRLWVGTGNRGLCTLDPGGNEFRPFPWGPGFAKTGPPSDANLLHVDRTDAIWVVTNLAGVFVIGARRDSVRHYVHDPQNPHSLGSNNVTAILEDRHGVIWIAGRGGSLDRFDRDAGRFERFGRLEWLSGSRVTGILDDERGQLWVATSNGLFRFDPRTKAHKRFDVEDGLLSSDLGRACRSSSGEMIIAAGTGIVIFHPDSIRDNPDVPPVYLTGFYLFNKPVSVGYDTASGRTILPRSIVECEELTLNHDENVFSFEFAALDFHAPSKNRYAYMIEGFDEDWTYTDASRSLVTYTNLDPGHYVLRVKGSNNDGVWNEAGVSLRLTILPPWWQTTWAYALFALLAAGTLYSAWRMKLRRIQIRGEYERSRFEAQKLHELDELKSRFFTNISHEFRTPLTLILGPAEQLLESSRDDETSEAAELIRRNAKKLDRLVGELLEISRIEAGKMSLKASPVNVVEAIKQITLLFSSHAERKRIALSFESQADGVIAYLDREKVEKVVSNVVSNAIKFTPAGGAVVVRVRPRAEGPQEETRAIEVSVHDTGIGIPGDKLGRIFDRFYQVDGSHTRESEGTGIGLALSKELMDV